MNIMYTQSFFIFLISVIRTIHYTHYLYLLKLPQIPCPIRIKVPGKEQLGGAVVPGPDLVGECVSAGIIAPALVTEMEPGARGTMSRVPVQGRQS